MKALKHATMIVSAAAALAVSGFFLLQLRTEAASGPEAASETAPSGPIDGKIVQIDAPPVPEDARLSGLVKRGDGARLLWAAAEGQPLSRAAFIDNGSMVVSATGFMAIDLKTRAVIRRLAAPGALASDHRPSNKNADRFCYAQPAGSGTFEIWCANQAWTDPQRLTTHDGPEDLMHPAISPEGGRVIFEVNTDRAAAKQKKAGASSIWIIGLNGSGLRQLSRGADDRFPTWSEDGGRVYFQRRAPDGNWDLYHMGADGSEVAPVMRTVDGDERWPVRIGKSAMIAAVAGPKGENGRVRLIDMETNSGRWLTSGETGPETDLSLSPDGRLVSFIAPVSADEPGRLGVWLKDIGF